MNLDIDFDYEEEYEFDFDFEEKARLVVAKALELHEVPYDCQLTLSVVSEDTIRELNRDTRKIDKITDVLSFPNIEFDEIADFSEAQDEAVYFDYFDPDTDNIILGDIVICLKRAMEQADEYGHSLEREMLFLTAHSILHLLGYDHMEEQERIQMEDKQREILDLLGIHR